MSTSTSGSIPGGEAPAPPRPGLNQPVTGVVPPHLAEANIRYTWPSVTGTSPGLARLGRALIRTIVLAPLAWLMLAPFYFKKVLPFLATRYTLTNRRLMIQRGVSRKAKEQVALSEIDDVRLVEDSYDPFYRAATLEVLSGGKVVLTLKGVPEPEAFRQSILNALFAWVPGKSRALPMIPASATADK